MISVTQSFAAQVSEGQRIIIYTGRGLKDTAAQDVVMIAISSEFGDTISVWDQAEQNVAIVPVSSSVVLVRNKGDVIFLAGPPAGQDGRLTRAGYLKGSFQVCWGGT